MRYSKEWKTIIGRFGRWIDFDNDYKTMDKTFMESVWWTFKQIFNKDLVYKGTRIMPFSTACNTVLSNFEAGSNYKDVSDPAIIVTFPIVSEGEFQGVNLVAWTTTPWTLPSNLALAVNPTKEYVIFRQKSTQEKYICLKARLKYVLKQAKIKDHEVIKSVQGSDLIGAKY
jgi:isoleucyl-tRNA synthetase